MGALKARDWLCGPGNLVPHTDRPTHDEWKLALASIRMTGPIPFAPFDDSGDGGACDPSSGASFGSDENIGTGGDRLPGTTPPTAAEAERL